MLNIVKLKSYSSKIIIVEFIYLKSYSLEGEVYEGSKY